MHRIILVAGNDTAMRQFIALKLSQNKSCPPDYVSMWLKNIGIQSQKQELYDLTIT